MFPKAVLQLIAEYAAELESCDTSLMTLLHAWGIGTPLLCRRRTCPQAYQRLHTGW